MGALSDLARDRSESRLPPGLFEGKVLSPALDSEGFLRVELDIHPHYVRHAVWTSTDPTPDAGAAVGCMESDNGNLWVIAIWPQ